MKIIIKYIILIASIALIGHFGSTQTVYATSDTPISDVIKASDEQVKTLRACGVGYYQANGTLLNISNAQYRLCELERTSTELSNKVKLLEDKLKNQPSPTKTETVVVQDNSRVDALEKRVSLLESAVNSIQNVVLSAINKAIGILDKLLGR